MKTFCVVLRAQVRENLPVLLAGGIAVAASATDWTQYRGNDHNGISQDRIQRQWDTSPPVELWRIPCTNGFSSMAVAGGRVYTQIRRDNGDGPKEVCVALDAATGTELWAREVGSGVYQSGPGDQDDGPRSTPSVQDGHVFVLTSYQVLHCLDATNGSPIWSKDLPALYGGSGIEWQSAASPLIDGDLIYVNCNTATQSLFAFRTADGSQAWRSQNAPMTHSTPVIATILGVPQVVFAARTSLISLNRTNGDFLWEAPYPFEFNTSLAGSPVVYSNLVAISANYTMGAFATQISLSNDVFVATPAWTNSNLRAHWMTPVCYQGYLYGMFGSQSASPLKCVDMQTGVQQWSMSGFGRGGTLLVNNRLLVLSEMGDLVLIDPNPAAYTELARFKAFQNYDAYTNKCWNVPAICDGRIYARSTAEAVCLDVSIPALRMLAPQFVTGNRLLLHVGTETGAPIDPGRFPNIEVRWTTDPSAKLTDWTRVTGGLSLVDGQVVVELDTLGEGAGFYVATEMP